MDRLRKSFWVKIMALNVVSVFLFSGLCIAGVLPIEGGNNKIIPAYVENFEKLCKGTPKWIERFMDIDTDNDGVISAGEYETYLKDRIKAEAEKHGYNLTAEQLDAIVAEWMKDFDKADADGSGTLTIEEVYAVKKGDVDTRLKIFEEAFNKKIENFAAIDTSGDGVISSEEYKAWLVEQGFNKKQIMNLLERFLNSADGDGNLSLEALLINHAQERNPRTGDAVRIHPSRK